MVSVACAERVAGREFSPTERDAVQRAIWDPIASLGGEVQVASYDDRGAMLQRYAAEAFRDALEVAETFAELITEVTPCGNDEPYEAGRLLLLFYCEA